MRRGDRRAMDDHAPAVGVDDVLRLLLMVVFMAAPSARLRNKTGGSRSRSGGRGPCAATATATATPSADCRESRCGWSGRGVAAPVGPHPLRRAPAAHTGAAQNILYPVEYTGSL